MKRACKVTLKYLTNAKRRRVNALLEAYRVAVNFYIDSLWKQPGKLNKDTLNRLPSENTRLSERYKSQALRQAMSIVASAKKSAKTKGKPCKKPVFKGKAILDDKFVSVEKGEGSFDLVVKMSSLKPRDKIVIPTKKTAVINKWLNKLGAEFIQGCSISEEGITLWIEIPDTTERSKGESLGVDIGVNKLLSDSEGNHYGTEFKEIRNKVNRKQNGSKAKRKALKHRDNFIRYTINRLPWQQLKLLAIENLKYLKHGKSNNRSKNFRKAMIPWAYRQVIEVLMQKCQENRVHLVQSEPAYTSQKCPSCGKVSKSNRKGEIFECINCGYSQDADYVGAFNILRNSLRLEGSLESPSPLKSLA